MKRMKFVLLSHLLAVILLIHKGFQNICQRTAELNLETDALDKQSLICFQEAVQKIVKVNIP